MAHKHTDDTGNTIKTGNKTYYLVQS